MTGELQRLGGESKQGDTGGQGLLPPALACRRQEPGEKAVDRNKVQIIKGHAGHVQKLGIYPMSTKGH